MTAHKIQIEINVLPWAIIDLFMVCVIVHLNHEILFQILQFLHFQHFLIPPQSLPGVGFKKELFINQNQKPPFDIHYDANYNVHKYFFINNKNWKFCK